MKGKWSSRVANARFLLGVSLRKPRLLARIARNYAALALGRTPLRFVDLAVDYACNLRCTHCSALDMLRKEASRLAPADYDRIGRACRREGALVFHLTGGEPLLRKDLADIIAALDPGSSLVSLQTNGLLATPERLRGLRRAGLDMMCVSLDSGIPEEHDAFRRRPGLFWKALRALDDARDAGLATAISTVVSHDSFESEGFRRVVEIAEQRGVWCFLNLAVPAGYWRGNGDVLFDGGDRRKLEAWIGEHPLCRTDFHTNYRRYGCGAVKEKLYVTAYGEVMPCPFIQIALGDLAREELATVRARGLGVKEFADYAPVCLAAEDRAFIEKNPCYSPSTRRLPVSIDALPWGSETSR